MICTNPKQDILKECGHKCCNDCDLKHCAARCSLSHPENRPCQWELSHQQILDLQHFKATIVGLWATDKPDTLTEEEQARCSLFKIE